MDFNQYRIFRNKVSNIIIIVNSKRKMYQNGIEESTDIPKTIWKLF